LPAQNHIISSCIIEQGTVLKDGSVLFKNKEVDLAEFLLSVYQHFQLNYPKFYKMDNLSKLGWLASEVLLKDNYQNDQYQPEEVGLVLANRNSSLDNDFKYFESAKEIASPSLFVYTLPNIVIGEICIRNDFKGEHGFYIQDSFDADFIAGQVNYLLNNHILEACICGWVDVLEPDYKAALYLVEKKPTDKSVPFSIKNINGIFETI
jgi:hypothetical protein